MIVLYHSLVNWIRRSIGISRTEANGYLILFAIMITLHFGITRYDISDEFALERQALADSLLAVFIKIPDTILPEPPVLAPFDPNTFPYDSLVAAGVLPMVAQNIIRYREAGGSFSRADDMIKIYGISDSLWTMLRPWIRLGKQASPGRAAVKKMKDGRLAIINQSERQLKDINIADSSWFKTIYGIGPVLSRRIVMYRELLGGFVSSEQLHEVYGLSPEVVERLMIKVHFRMTGSIRKININQAEYDRLVMHPYLSFDQARAIIAYREQHGPLENVEEIKKIHLIDDSTYLRVSPYLDF